MEEALKEDLFDRIREEIRKQRGMNRFRGSEFYLLDKGEIRIPVENRKSAIQAGYYVIHVQGSELETWAKSHSGGPDLYLKEFDMDMGRFVEAVIDQCRGEAYLHTSSKHADYRKIKEDTKDE